jgi:hypothetical protein
MGELSSSKVDVPLLPIEDPDATLLHVPYIPQPNSCTNLCWAACCEMIFQKYGRTVSLCQLASEAFRAKCCPDPSSAVCNKTYWPDDNSPNDIYSLHGFDHAFLPAGLELANVLYEINNGRPVIAVLNWLGSDGEDEGRHMIVIAGYYPNCDLLVKDPLNGEGRLAYDYVNAAYGRGRWSESYYSLAPRNGT